MHVITQKVLLEFGKKHADADGPLRAWLKLVKHGAFKNLVRLKQTFPSVDLVPVNGHEFYVFNIGGGRYRLVAASHFNTGKLFVRHLMKHADYDKADWKRNP